MQISVEVMLHMREWSGYFVCRFVEEYFVWTCTH